MPALRLSNLLFTSLVSALLLYPLCGIVIAQSTEKSAPVQTSGQSNQQSFQEGALAEARRLNQQALELNKQGRYDAAIPLAERALAIYEKALGPDHPDVATALANLALSYQSKRDYARAEPLLQRALAIHEKALGPEHPDVASTLNSLAGLYRTRGDYAHAEPLYQRALAIYEKRLGPNDPNVASILTNLAILYQSRGDYARAEPLHQRALAIFEKEIGRASCRERVESMDGGERLEIMHQGVR